MKTRKPVSLLSNIGCAVCFIGLLASLAGCSGTCAVITKFETEPQWVCPGSDFSANVHFKIETFDEDGEHSAQPDADVLTMLLDVTNADLSTPGLIANKPGAVKITNKLGTLQKPSPGVIETPANGFTIVGSSQAKPYQFALIASCLDCKEEGEEYLLKIQKDIEKHYGVELDDDEIMTALCDIELVRAGGPQQICVPHVEDAVGGWYFVKDEIRGGVGIVIDYVENTNPFSINIMPPGQPSKILSAAGQPGAITHDFDGYSPNGQWKIKMPSQQDYDNFIKHNKKYLGKPSICITVGIKCQ